MDYKKIICNSKNRRDSPPNYKDFLRYNIFVIRQNRVMVVRKLQNIFVLSKSKTLHTLTIEDENKIICRFQIYKNVKILMTLNFPLS